MANIRDIAKLANVSAATVSRVINQHPYVSEEKRAAVWRVIEEHNYHVNMNAVHLSKGKTYLIGVVLPYVNHPYYGQLIEGISNLAVENNYNLILFQTNYHLEKEKEALDMLKHKQVDALIICSRACGIKTIKSYKKYGRIVLFENINEENLSSTYVDHYGAFKTALDYLHNKGHKKIGYCIGRRSGTNSRQRELAYRDFLKEIKEPFRSEYIIDKCLYFEDSTHVMEQIERMSDPPSALLVTSDQVAAGILTYCMKHSISVPNNLAIVGFDNQPIAKLLDITTIEMNLVEIGKKMFLQAIDEKKTTNEKITARLIERSTV